MPLPNVTTYTPKEIIYGDERNCTKVPAMVAAGQTLAKGTVMGKVTGTGLLIPYNHANADGSQTPVGILAQAVDTTTAGNGNNPERASVYIGGYFIVANLTNASPANYIADSGGLAWFVNTFGILHLP